MAIRYFFGNLSLFIQKSKMKLKEIAAILDASISCGAEKLEHEVEMGYSSDLMSDVLTLDTDNLVLLTGLVNLQAIRTAEMADIRAIVFVRNKKASQEMIDLARENGMCILESPYSLFKSSGMLFQSGLKPIY
jgi:predicted transcriptional regulator